MKKIFTFIAALCMGIGFVNAQVDSVIVNGNGTYEQYVDTVVTPVDSTMFFDTIDVIYDTTVIIDTIGDVMDTTLVVDTVYNIDTNYAIYDTTMYNMIMAIPDSGWIFNNWVITFYGTVEYADTFYTISICTDWADSLVSIVLNFDSVMFTDIANIENGYRVNVYPNPTTGCVTVDVDKYKDCTVYNMGGVVMISTTSKRIDMTNIPSGMYIMRVRLYDNTVLTHKVFKK